MRGKLPLFIFLGIGVSSWLCAEKWQDAAKNEEYKKARELIQKELVVASPKEKPALMLEKCLLLLKDQKEEEAFFEFQKAIAELPKEPREISQEEKKLFEQALQIYFTESEKPLEVVVEELQTFLSPKIAAHSEYTTLTLLQALTYANKHQYSEFFKLFFKAYPKASGNYLVDKTMGICTIKLFEKAKTSEEKEKHAKEIMAHVQSALQKEPRDMSLYKLLVAFCPQAEKKEMLVKTIDRIIANDVPVPKKELPYYVMKALSYNEIESAKKLVVSAKKWYTYSRIVEELEKVIENESNS